MTLVEPQDDVLDGRQPENVAGWLQHYLNTMDEGADCEARIGFYKPDLAWMIVLTCPGVDDLALPVDIARRLIRVLVKRRPQQTALIAALIVAVQLIQNEETNWQRPN
jgi:hypothetical protein